MAAISGWFGGVGRGFGAETSMTHDQKQRPQSWAADPARKMQSGSSPSIRHEIPWEDRKYFVLREMLVSCSSPSQMRACFCNRPEFSSAAAACVPANAGQVAGGCRHDLAAGACPVSANVIRKRVPPSGLAPWTSILAQWRSATSLTIARPRPVPWPGLSSAR